MRTVAALLALSSVLLLIPVAVAADECATNATQQTVCVVIPATKPATVPPAPSTPNTPYWGTYYLFVAGDDCIRDPLGNPCTGRPVAPGSGVPLPQGGSVGSGAGIGVLYQESNGRPGLQRFQAFPVTPDRIILV